MGPSSLVIAAWPRAQHVRSAGKPVMHHLPALPAAGPQQVLLLSLVRFAFLLLVGVLTYKAFGHQQADGLSRLSRTALCQAAIFAQLLWFTSELVLGSALLAFLPLVQGGQWEEWWLHILLQPVSLWCAQCCTVPSRPCAGGGGEF